MGKGPSWRVVLGYRFWTLEEWHIDRRIEQVGDRDRVRITLPVPSLVELGLLDKDEQGRLAAPFDEIVIHATIRDAA